jgi:hypothetical protein
MSRIDPVVGPGPAEADEPAASRPKKVAPWRKPAKFAPSGKKIGRPRDPNLEKRFQPSLEQREVVRLLSGFGLPHERICRAVRNPLTRRPINVSTLLRHFESELQDGAAAVDALVAGTFVKQLRSGSLTCAIWLSKNLWDFSDHVTQTGTTRSAVDLTVKIDPAELERRLEARGLAPQFLGIDKPVLEPRRDAVGHALANGNGLSKRDDG